MSPMKCFHAWPPWVWTIMGVALVAKKGTKAEKQSVGDVWWGLMGPFLMHNVMHPSLAPSTRLLGP